MNCSPLHSMVFVLNSTRSHLDLLHAFQCQFQYRLMKWRGILLTGSQISATFVYLYQHPLYIKFSDVWRSSMTLSTNYSGGSLHSVSVIYSTGPRAGGSSISAIFVFSWIFLGRGRGPVDEYCTGFSMFVNKYDMLLYIHDGKRSCRAQ